jgi:hypothetical protein
MILRELRNFFENAFEIFLKNDLNPTTNNEIKKFSRKKLTEDFSKLLNSVT